MSKKISALIVFGLCASLFYWSELKLEQLVEINSIAIVFGSLFPIVFVLARNGAAHWSESMVALGVPLGLLGGTIGVTGILGGTIGINGMSAWMGGYSTIYPATAIMLVTVLYGGIVSALGYFATDGAEKQNNRLSRTSLVRALFPFACIVLYSMLDAAVISIWLSLEALSVFFAVFASQIFLGQKFSFQRVTEGALFAAILCLVLALIQWYSAGELDPDAINLAINGLTYGLIIYIFAYVISRSQGDNESDKMETGRANWHWMEVTAFMVFMLFAPETLRETLMNEEDTVAKAEETVLLEQRFASLEQRISDIENQ